MLKIPWISLLGAFWAVIRLKWWGLDIVLEYTTPLGVGLLIVTFGALLLEFWKSVDIREGNFFWDLTFALLTLGGAVYTITILDQRNAWNVLDIFIFFILALDAWISPWFAFKTALRNEVHSS